MWALFDDSPGTIFASAAGLIVHFELLSAIPVVWAISEQDEKHSIGKWFGFPKGIPFRLRGFGCNHRNYGNGGALNSEVVGFQNVRNSNSPMRRFVLIGELVSIPNPVDSPL